MNELAFERLISPFFWVDHSDSASVCLDVGSYKKEVFATREDEGVKGSGYDWSSLAMVFLEERNPELLDEITFDSEAGTFCVYSSNRTALKRFITRFKAVCENDQLIKELFSRVELV